MKRIFLYLFIYSFILSILAKKIDFLLQTNPIEGIMALALWVCTSSGIVHIIHYWPKNQSIK